jgi:hypothetical protein
MKKTVLSFLFLSLLPCPLSLVPCPLSLVSVVSAQPTTRIATNVEALTATPVFFHGRQIVVRQPITGSVELTRLDSTSKPIFVFLKEPPGAVRDPELRGEFWDLGRIQQDDSRFANYNFEKVLEAVSAGQWPARDRVFVILNATLSEAPLPPAPTIRAIVLAPERYSEREVRVSGRFRGRNLYGDLPQPLNKDRWDFVLQSADASIWVSGMRPKGKDFELDPGARVDTGKWLEVTGVVQRKGAQLWIEASAMRPTTASSDVPVEVVVPVRPVDPPPTVVFTAPVQDDVEVERGASVRIQFSRDLAGASIANRIRVTYTSAPPGGQPPPPPAFTAAYQEGTRSLEIKFAQPLERFTAVKVELLEGITAFDGQPLGPYTLTFTTGG